MSGEAGRPDITPGTEPLQGSGQPPENSAAPGQLHEQELLEQMLDSTFVDAVRSEPARSDAPAAGPDETVPGTDDDQDDDRATPTIWEQMGGPMGMIDSGLPVLVFVIVNAITSLQPAIFAALGAGVLIAILRLVRKKPVTQAVAGLFGVGIAAFIAYKSGSAKGFFAFGIWSYLVYGGALIASILVRWPLIGVIWEGINGRGNSWRSDRKVVRRYDWATGVWIAIFAARYLVQNSLYDQDQVGWLATAKIAMGYPLYFVGIGLTVWIIKGRRPSLKPAG